MTGLIVLSLDADVAGHLAVALHRHRSALQKIGAAEPEGLARLEQIAQEVVRSTHGASQAITVRDASEDVLHDREFLSRRDVQRLTGVSLATVDRWIKSGELPSVKRGRVRRIERSALHAFQRAA